MSAPLCGFHCPMNCYTPPAQHQAPLAAYPGSACLLDHIVIARHARALLVNYVSASHCEVQRSSGGPPLVCVVTVSNVQCCDMLF
jgi:hypothetical protein